MSELQTFSKRIDEMAGMLRGVQVLPSMEAPEVATLPYASYQALLELLEDLEDSLALEEARREDDGTRIPFEDVLKDFEIAV